MELSEFEKKRAANQIWNSAGDYGISPGFRMYDEEGRAELYWNSMIGAMYRHYDWERLMVFYNSFHETVEQELYENLFWLAMENACFGRESVLRPALPLLREDYARRKLRNSMPGISESRAGWIMEGHFRHALGEDSGLPDLVDRKLLAEIELSSALDTEQCVAAITAIFRKYFTYRPTGVAVPGKKCAIKLPFRINPFGKRNGRGSEPVRRLVFGFGENVTGYRDAEGGDNYFTVRAAKYTARTEEGLRKYITAYFGLPLFDEAKLSALERTYCCGNHQGCRLYVTRGETTAELLKAGFAGKMRKAAIEQEQRNRRAYEKRLAENRIAIGRLTEKIRNALQILTEDELLRAETGKFKADRVYRALQLGDRRIFEKNLRGEMGDITVDLLLDASASQLHRMETVSAQGYIIAESLSRCGIPVRVYAYSSMSGYTIFNLFRDYGEQGKNGEIFRYFTAGCNRDGLGIRFAAGMMHENSAAHRLLIVLTDVKPNDVVQLQVGGIQQSYANEAAVEDTAAEVHRARMDGIEVLCVFTGEDADLPDVRRIFDHSFVKIRSVEHFADAVGTMLRDAIGRL